MIRNRCSFNKILKKINKLRNYLRFFCCKYFTTFSSENRLKQNLNTSESLSDKLIYFQAKNIFRNAEEHLITKKDRRL